MTDDKATIAALHEALATTRHGASAESDPCWCVGARTFVATTGSVVHQHRCSVLRDLLTVTATASAAFVERVRAEARAAVRDENVSRTIVEFATHSTIFVCDACGLRQPWTGSIPPGHDVGIGHFGPQGQGGWHAELVCSAVSNLAKHDAEVRAAALEEAAKTLCPSCRRGVPFISALMRHREGSGFETVCSAYRLRALAQVHPPGQAGHTSGDGATARGGSVAGGSLSPSLTTAPEGAAPVCATCGGACFVRTSMYPGSLSKCPDCARGGT